MSIGLGILTGLTTALYFKGLEWIQSFHVAHTKYIYFLPLTWLVLKLIKRQTLYFPTSVSGAMDSSEVRTKHWNKAMLPLNLVGSWLSHMTGASVGREGTNMVLTASIANLMKLEWSYWRPIAISVGFAAAIGHPWIALVFIWELFKTDNFQKMWTAVAAWTACLIVQSLRVPHLLPDLLIVNQDSIGSKIMAAFAIAFCLGFMAQVHKRVLGWMRNLFTDIPMWVGFIAVLGITLVLARTDFKVFHSLSLNELHSILSGQTTIKFAALKFLLTIICVGIGFWGGEFVPIVVIGSAVGVLIAKAIGVDFQFGLMLGSMGLFCGITRLKWTSFLLAAVLTVGWTHLIWIYLTYALIRTISGNTTIYAEEI